MSERLQYGVFGEDDSDFEMLKVLIRRLAGDDRLTVGGRGYSGKGELLKSCARDLRELRRRGFHRFVIAQDADTDDLRQIEVTRQRYLRTIVEPSGIEKSCCVVLPVQAIEAWILADVDSIAGRFRMKPEPIHEPERLARPKDILVRLSRDDRGVKHYHPVLHNKIVAQGLDLDRVADRCPSFRPLREFVHGDRHHRSA